MAIEIRLTGDDCADVRIDGELTIYTAAQVKGVLMEALAAHSELHVELTELAEVDTAGVQLLLMLQREAQRAHKLLMLSAPSPALRDVVSLLDLTELALPAEALA